MQKLFLGRTNRVYLDTEETIDAATFSLVTTTGSYVKDSSEADVQEKTCILDSSNGKYYYDLILSSSAVPDDCFIYWAATQSTIAVSLEPKYSPEDAVITEAIQTDRLLVSVTYVMDQYLRGISEAEIEATFSGLSYRDTIREQIQSATQHLETKTKLFFSPTTVVETHDYLMDPIPEKFWTQYLHEFPVVSITTMELKLNQTLVATIPAEWIVIGNAKEGLLKVVPYAGGISGFAFRMIAQGGMGIALVLGEANHIPDFFHITYEAGLDWDNLPANLKRNFRTAIARRVALQMLPNLDVHRGISSETRSVDGASTSKSYTSSATFGEHSAALEEYKKQETDWIDATKGK